MTAAEVINGGSWCARCVQDNAECANTALPFVAPGYTCTCNAGYEDTSEPTEAVECTDIDECGALTAPCDVLPHPNRGVFAHSTHCRTVQPEPERVALALGSELSLEHSEGMGVWLFTLSTYSVAPARV